jgi:hypothetical protein
MQEEAISLKAEEFFSVLVIFTGEVLSVILGDRIADSVSKEMPIFAIRRNMRDMRGALDGNSLDSPFHSFEYGLNADVHAYPF